MPCQWNETIHFSVKYTRVCVCAQQIWYIYISVLSSTYSQTDNERESNEYAIPKIQSESIGAVLKGNAMERNHMYTRNICAFVKIQKCKFI